MVKIVLPDHSVKEFENEPSVLEVAEKIGNRLKKDTLAGKIRLQTQSGNQQLDHQVDSQIVDLRTKLKDGTRLEIITTQSPEANDIIRHSAAHMMAQAVQALWPDVKVTIGPVIQEGFYYDFDSPRPFSEEDFEKIEKKMAEISNKNYVVEREEWEIQKAIDFFQKNNEKFKVEIIQDLAAKGETAVSVYRQGDWLDLCRGPHVQSTGQVKAFKLMSVAGAYWRGDESREQLQRLYATAFSDKKDLEDHLRRIEEAKKRDHRKLGKELDLFMFHPWAPGSPFFTGKGGVVYNELVGLMRDLYREHGYQEVITPQVFDVELYHRSGHYENYRENMYFTEVEKRQFSLKPMNCPGHCLMFGAGKHSYRDLPLRIADFGRLHRYERSGTMHGLTRVRTFCQDDAHIFCALEQLQGEIENFVRLLNQTYKILGMDNYKIFLSTRPPKRMGSDEIWDKAENSLKLALEKLGLLYTVNPGDGAFYGPKLDIMFVDALQRPWQLGTLQLDFNLPKNFDLKFTGEDNQEHQPVMLHRAILGSLERFIGVYLEHTAGHLPPWLMPVQVQILGLTDRVQDYCLNLEKQLIEQGVRVHFDSRNESLKYKVRQAQVEKIPYMLVIGDQEAQEKLVTVRLRNGVNTNNIKFDDFVVQLKKSLEQRQYELLNFSV